MQYLTFIALLVLLFLALVYLVYSAFFEKRPQNYQFYRGQKPMAHLPKNTPEPSPNARPPQKTTNPASFSKTASPPAPHPIQKTSPEASDLLIPQEPSLPFTLLMEEDLDESQWESMHNITDKIMRPRGIFTSLLVGQLGPKELADLVASDPEIATKILRIVNSAAYGLTRKITSIQRAAMFLGTTLVRDIAMRLCMQNVLSKGSVQLERTYHVFWQSSVVASHLCQRLAVTFGFSEPSTLATRTLLSFIGNLVILSNRPEIALEYQRKNSLLERTRFEQDVIQTNAALLGGVLCQKWKLPDEIGWGIRHSLWPLCPLTEIDNLPTRELAEIVLSYICCRIGEQIIFKGFDDIAHCTLKPEQSPDFAHIPAYLERTQLMRLPQALQQLKLRQEIHTLIDQIGARHH